MLEVEVAVVPGTGKIEITGNLGTVMQESAKAAVTFVRSKAESLNIDPMFYRTTICTFTSRRQRFRRTARPQA